MGPDEMGPDEMGPDGRATIAPPGDRLRAIGRDAALGFGLGAAGVLLAAAAGIPARDANAVVFPLAAMVFGIGLAAWASLALYGTSLERGARRADVSTTFSSAGAAESTGRLAVIGLAGMVGGTVATLALTSLAG